MKRFFAAIRFLTILPLPASWAGDEVALKRSVPFFPVVGLLIGGVAAGTAYALTHVLPPLPAAVLITTVLAGVSGGLHLDGLADSADGLLSARPRQRVLEIMKDSHIGAMGVIALVLVLCLKISALGSLPGDALWRAALLMPVAGRCALVLAMAMVPYARPDGGLGRLFFERRPRVSAVWAIVVLAATGWLVAGYAGVAAAGASLVLVGLFTTYTYLRIGGATGDTLGATCEIVELVPPLTLAVWLFLVPTLP